MVVPVTNEVLAERIEFMRVDVTRRLAELDNDLRDDYVRREEFVIVKGIVFGMVSIVLGSALLLLMIKIGWR